MITLKLKYSFEDSCAQDLILEYMNQYTHVFRVAYNKLYNQEKIKQVDLLKLNNISLLDSWWIASAMIDAKMLYNRFKTQKVIFGGKQNFLKRCKHQIDKETFNLNRLSNLSSIGEKKSGTKSVHGNRKFKLTADLKQVTLKLKDKKVKLNLIGNYSKNLLYKLSQVYKHQILDDTPLTYKIDISYIYITFDESIVLSSKLNLISVTNRVLSLDLNPNYIGWSITDWKSSSEFNVIKSGVYIFKNLTDKIQDLKGNGFSSESPIRKHLNNKLEYETYQVVKNLIKKAIYYKVQLIGIEDLSIKSKNLGKGRYLNGLINNKWLRNKVSTCLEKYCNIYGFKFQKVKPEYSSFIGNFLFRSLNLPDMVLSSIEIGRRCYEFYEQYISKQNKIQKNIIQPNLKDFNSLYIKSLEEFNIQNTEFKDFKDLYYIFKNSKLTYRVPIQNNVQVYRFNSIKSAISAIHYN